jgi:hypothetical protein
LTAFDETLVAGAKGKRNARRGELMSVTESRPEKDLTVGAIAAEVREVVISPTAQENAGVPEHHDAGDGKRSESLLKAERRMLEMIANGVGLSAVLNELCTAIDAQASGAISFVCLMDPDGKQLLSSILLHAPPTARLLEVAGLSLFVAGTGPSETPRAPAYSRLDAP